MELDLVGLVFGVITAVASGGAVAGATRTKLRRLELDVTEVRTAAARHAAEDAELHNDMTDRLARIETKLDLLVDRSK